MNAPHLLYLCINRRRPGDWSSFVRYYDHALRGALVGALHRRGQAGDEDCVDELMQELYCRLIAVGHRRGRLRYRSTAAAWGYLRKSIEAVVVDHLRKLGRRRRRIPWYHLRGRSIRPAQENALLAREALVRLIRRCRRHVAEPHRQLKVRALCLALIGGWSSREIARWSRGVLSPAGVDALVHRTRKRLAAQGITIGRRGRPCQDVERQLFEL